MSYSANRVVPRLFSFLRNKGYKYSTTRTLSQYYPIDENIFGLNEQQKEVSGIWNRVLKRMCHISYTRVFTFSWNVFGMFKAPKDKKPFSNLGFLSRNSSFIFYHRIQLSTCSIHECTWICVRIRRSETRRRTLIAINVAFTILRCWSDSSSFSITIYTNILLFTHGTAVSCLRIKINNNNNKNQKNLVFIKCIYECGSTAIFLVFYFVVSLIPLKYLTSNGAAAFSVFFYEFPQFLQRENRKIHVASKFKFFE